MKKHKNVIGVLSLFVLGCLLLSGCSGFGNTGASMSGEDGGISLTFEAQLYDNQGNNYVTFRGNEFNITPNKVKQYGYDSDGDWTYWYETSSVVSVEIDGYNVQTCGSTIIFKDSRLEIQPLTESIGTLDSSNDSGYTTFVGDDNFTNYLALTRWWIDTHETGQGGSKIILIQSQDGYNIGVIEGKDITWEVADKLPKTTLITVDDKPLYIHRCNFTIIDTALFDNVVLE